MRDLRGRNALLTGAGGGLGGYIARALAEEGVNLALTDLPEAPVDGLAAELRTGGVRVEHAPSDLTDRTERERLVGWAEDQLGPLDVLVNNAGVEFGGSFLVSTSAELELTVMVNLLAVMDLTRLVLPRMLERGRGHVVSMASVAGKIPTPQLASYSATKHGVVGFTHSLRAEYRSEPVEFSAICPVFVSKVGMYGKVEQEVGDPPWELASVPPEAIGEAVLKAIREERPEIVVSKRPIRPISALSAVWPAAAARLLGNRRTRRFADRFAQARGRLQ